MGRILAVFSTAFLCAASANTTVAQERSPISRDTVSEIRHFGYLPEDISFIGPHTTTGHVIVETRQSTVVFDNQSSRLVQRFTRSTSILDATTLKEVEKLDRPGDLSSISQDGTKRLWQQPHGEKSSFTLDSERQVTCVLEGFNASVAGSAFHPNQEFVAVNVWEFDPSETECRVGFSNIRLFTTDGRLVRRIASGSGGSALLAFNPNGSTLAVANLNSNQTELIDLATGNVLQTFPGGAKSQAGEFHPAGEMIALFGSDNLQVWDTKSGESLHTIELETRGGLGGVLWSANGDMLIVACDGELTFWETETWKKMRELRLYYRGVSKLMMTPDGSRLITVSKSVDEWHPDAWMVESFGLE